MTKPTEDQLETLHNLNRILRKRILVEKSLSRESMIVILHPMENMDWENKAMYVEKLIEILNTTETEEDILMKAEQIQI